MTVLGLIQLLQQRIEQDPTIADLPVLVDCEDTGHSSGRNVFSPRVSVIICDEDEYPDDFEMPEGFRFLQLGD